MNIKSFFSGARSPVVFLVPVLLAVPASAQEHSERTPPTIRVTGEASLSAQPDQAKIELGVVTQAEKSEAAASRNAQRLEKVLAELRGVVGPDGKIETVGYSLTPDYRHDGREPTIVGYTASNVVRATLNDLSKVGRVIDVASTAGANRVQGLQFTLKDETAVRGQALREAATKARSKADALAAALGLDVVRVLHVSESGGPAVPVRDVMFARAEAASTPIEPGTVEIRVAVDLTVEVKGK
jgi:uncharacterized protein YggE